MKKKLVLSAVVVLTLLALVSIGLAAGRMKMAEAGGKIILAPEQLSWQEGPAALPGSKMTVLEGDPGRRGFFVMRLKLPAGAKIPPHTHKNRERVTIISGKFNLAMGDKPENPIVLPAGGYFSLAPGHVHNAWVDEETVLQISTAGPWTFRPVSKEPEKK